MYDHALAHKHICNAIEQSFQAERYSDTAFSLVTLVCGTFLFFFVWVPRKIMLLGTFGENVAPLRETIGDYQEPEGDHRVTPPPLAGVVRVKRPSCLGPVRLGALKRAG